MTVKQLLFTLGVCFGVGIGVAPRATAHACSCEESLTFTLAEVFGEGDVEAESLTWDEDIDVTGSWTGEYMWLGFNGYEIELELVQ